ncbi:Predicted RNA binding protein YcfA, dsRBD-like fold, HicA-like mRNA interferase family [Selenomonas sp. GACV-9]|uniref:type II toxin-antitoxin system HicA family toxin n=1 Tax=Selenomonas sp. GACV-9 TaxID=3158782 RepID=UPI0008EBADC5|nr:Predicted RNA binding protein YcfA, dsRBD-like fold, HicA-like mRNA interferase family [Selenomonas ruminantium]
MKGYSSREILKILKKDGWREVTCIGDHHQLKHPTKKERVTVRHPVKDLSRDDLKSIEKQSGLTFD